MTLEPTRAGAYLAGALAGGFTTAFLVAVRRGAARAACRNVLLAVGCGGLAVALEELTRYRSGTA